MMKHIRVIVVLILLQVALCAFDTSSFWRKSLNESGELHFQTYAGYQQIDWYLPRGTSGMYYQLFGAVGSSLNESDTRVPLIIWLNGGPGSSSLFGAFTENGPIRILKNKATYFQNPWNLLGHTLYIDQPLNVGFSYYGNRTAKKQVVGSAADGAMHLENFLYNFYREWPKLASSPLYITGESFAGHYIPAFASRIVQNATFLAATKVTLKGVAIGDGWVDPINQINFYDSLLYSVGIVSNKFRDVCTWVQTQGMIGIYEGNFGKATEYWDYLTNDDSVWDKYMGGMNEFNFRQYTGGDETFADFLQANKGSLGVPSQISYIPGNGAVYDSFHEDISKSYTTDLVILLRNNIRVLIYNGQQDYVVNTAGVLNYINSLQWEGITSWKRSRKEVWTIDKEIKGWAKTYGNLWFVLVNKAGHLVPTDQPGPAFNMLGHFIHNDRNWRQ